jgi:hypothetical protein
MAHGLINCDTKALDSRQKPFQNSQMGRSLQYRRARTSWALALTVLAMAMRIMIPGGYMVAGSDAVQGLPQVVICTGQGAITVQVDAEGQVVKTSLKPTSEPSHSDKDRPDPPCAFSATSAAAKTDSHSLPLALVRISHSSPLPLASVQRPGLGLAAPPPWTTGPPSIL